MLPYLYLQEGEQMLKEKLSNLLKSIAEETAKVASNDASAWAMYQEEEPEEVRQKRLVGDEILDK